MVFKETFYSIDHSEICYNHSMKKDYGNRFYQNSENESLIVNESEIHIECHAKIDDKSYYYFNYDIEEFDDNNCWRVF